MIIKIKKLRENAVIPTRGTDYAGGWDVTASEIEYTSDGRAICKLGIAVEIPEGYRLIASPRSSLTKTTWVIQNSPCLIDADYRGELMIVFRPLDQKTTVFGFDNPTAEFPYQVGDRVAQCYLEEIIPMEFEEVETLSETVRGSGGYGSTGK